MAGPKAEVRDWPIELAFKSTRANHGYLREYHGGSGTGVGWFAGFTPFQDAAPVTSCLGSARLAQKRKPVAKRNAPQIPNRDTKLDLNSKYISHRNHTSVSP
ncbi:predicted protein [Plenodomus lingam JN3]|uniref:Predicted protein n=1 Tax=Leptosphaeria maculans (strain JN3 / isolate v23.1.3 / race Av1-4-5-6-7-8) TaxID=985895 RepID=E4ZY94_LEPMJ|nr:predicted protein [Plenodomus lingam JN3]CBX96339.1 predicted protein [Plenodomus lingam JN3]